MFAPKKILLQIPAGDWYPQGIGKKIDEYGDERLRKVTVGPFGSEENQKNWAVWTDGFKDGGIFIQIDGKVCLFL